MLEISGQTLVIAGGGIASLTGGVILSAPTRRSSPAQQRSWLKRTLAPIVKTISESSTAEIAGLGVGVMLSSVTALYFTTSFLLAIGVAVAVFTLWIPTLAKRRARRLEQGALQAWPEVLSELQLRIGALGMPLPSALFLAGSSNAGGIEAAFLAAERGFAITGSFDSALTTLVELLPDYGTELVAELLSAAQEAPGSEISRLIEDMRIDRLAERERQGEYRAKLAGVNFARYFVVAVPIGMMAAGAGIAGVAPYRSGLGIIGIAFSGTILVGCWLWASRLASPSNLYTKRRHR